MRELFPLFVDYIDQLPAVSFINHAAQSADFYFGSSECVDLVFARLQSF